MLIAQSIFAGVVAIATVATCFVYHKLADIEQQRLDMAFDPELLVRGWWRHTGRSRNGERIGKWTSDLYLANPSPTPIFVMLCQPLNAAPGTTHTVKEYSSTEAKSQSTKTLFIAGYSAKRMEVVIEGASCEGYQVKYSTARGGGMKTHVSKLFSLVPDAPSQPLG